MRKHIIQIDGLRCYAVLSVMVAHYIVGNYGGAILYKIPFGTGVNLFFVISGYLITAILLHKKDAIHQKTTTFFKEIKKFYVRRSLRIFPLYYLVLLFIFIFSFEQIKDYYGYLLSYTTNIYITIHNGYIDNRTHLWSLAVEEQFYLIWPFIVFLMPKKWMLSFIVSIIFFSIISKYYFIHYTSYPLGANAFLTSCLDSLGLGSLLAYLQLYHSSVFEKILNKKILIILIISYIILFIFPDFTSYSIKRIFDNFSTSLIYFYIVGIASLNKFNGFSKLLLENKIALYLGKISYGIYLIHNFMGEAFQNYFARKLPPTDHLSVRIIYWALLTVILASISWYFLERPILKLKKYFN